MRQMALATPPRHDATVSTPQHPAIAREGEPSPPPLSSCDRVAPTTHWPPRWTGPARARQVNKPCACPLLRVRGRRRAARTQRS